MKRELTSFIAPDQSQNSLTKFHLVKMVSQTVLCDQRHNVAMLVPEMDGHVTSEQI